MIKLPQGYEHMDSASKQQAFNAAVANALKELQESVSNELTSLQQEVEELQKARKAQISLNSQLMYKTGLLPKKEEKTPQSENYSPKNGFLSLLINLFRRNK